MVCVRAFHIDYTAAAYSPQGDGGVYATGVAGPPSPVLAATAIAWFMLSRMLGWSWLPARAEAQRQLHTCGRAEGGLASVVAALQLLPTLSLLETACDIVSSSPRHPGDPGAVKAMAPGLQLQAQRGCQEAMDALQTAMQAAAPVMDKGCALSVLQLASVHALGRLLGVVMTPQQPAALVAALVDAACLAQQLQRLLASDDASADPHSKQTDAVLRTLATASTLPPLAMVAAFGGAAAGSGSFSQGLPALCTLMPVLQPALASSSSTAVSNESRPLPALQEAALALLQGYLPAAAAAVSGTGGTCLAGGQQLLQDALDLICSPFPGVRSAALALVDAYLQPEVLDEAFGRPPAQAAADGQLLSPLPQRRLVEHLGRLLQAADHQTTAGGDAAGAAGAASSIAARESVLRCLAGLFPGLQGSECEELPLLYLLQQCTSDVMAVRRGRWREAERGVSAPEACMCSSQRSSVTIVFWGRCQCPLSFEWVHAAFKQRLVTFIPPPTLHPQQAGSPLPAVLHQPTAAAAVVAVPVLCTRCPQPRWSCYITSPRSWHLAATLRACCCSRGAAAQRCLGTLAAA